ncbi:MAG TPA: Fic family protein [Flavisolibacter sp.]|nr:Fic family protein [Flavisolibacter sp.]
MQASSLLPALEAFSDGVNIETLKGAISFTGSNRTLQRWLGDLIREGKVYTTGRNKAIRYHLAQPVQSLTDKAATLRTSGLNLSEQSQALMKVIRQPLEARKPVGYNRGFLDRYAPNITSYLTLREKKKLAETGRTTTGDQPAGTYARQILNRLLIDLSWNSSRLEGNTYSLLDTQRLLLEGTATPEKSARETQMILNHKEAIEFLVQNADDSIGFNRYTIQSLHALLSNNLLGDPGASGRLRSFGVGITSSVYTPLGIPQQIAEMFDLILEKASAINDPFEQAFFVMVHLPYLQPFDDVNKRVSRLAANIPLNRHNLAPLSFTEVPQDVYVSGLLAVYEQNDVSLLKDVFLWAYERSAARYAALRQTLGEPDPFRLKYREQIRAVIREIIMGALSRADAPGQIKHAASFLPEPEQQRFTEAVETELMSLHEGNFARYLVTPKQYQNWKAAWEA